MHDERDDELTREITSHLELEAEEREAEGLSADEARVAARRAFGSVLKATEDTQAVWRWTLAEQAWQDIRHGLRNLWRQPTFALLTVSTLALSIGANAAIFTVVNAALLRPLPYPEPERLVAVSSVNRARVSPPTTVSPADYQDWRQARSLEQLAAYGGADVRSIVLGDQPQAITTARVTWNFFRTMGVRPLLGADFTVADETMSTPGVNNVVLSHRAWQSQFGGDRTVIGRTIRMSSASAVVIGVMPPDFRFPDYADLWIPIGGGPELAFREARYLRVVGRLGTGQSVDAARGELEGIAARLAQTYPKEDKNWSVDVTPLDRAVVRDVRRPLWLLMGGVAFIIVIGCANVAGLVLVRTSARRREIAVRVALGASRARLVRQLLAEGLVLALAGAAGGLLVARWGVALFFALLPQTAWSSLARFRDQVPLDGAVLAFVVALSALTTVALTLTPVGGSLKIALAESVRTGRGRPAREHWGYRLLVAGQFACAIVLLAGAGLLMQSFMRMLTVERGYDSNGLLVIALPQSRGDSTFVDRTLARVTAAPGIEAATVMSGTFFGQLNFPINLDDRPLPDGDVVVRYSAVTPEYFRVLRAPVRSGRAFDIRDAAGAPRVAMINDTLARQFFGDQNPIGRTLVLAYNRQRIPLNIVGVTGDIRQDPPGQPVHPEVVVPWSQAPWLAATLVVRVTGDPVAAQSAARDAIRSVDRALVGVRSRTLDEILDSQVATPRLYTILFATFAAIAVGLAALGIYGLFSYVVGRRTNEIAVRIALGGQRSGIIRMVVGEGARLSLAGIGCGLLGALALAGLMRGLLFEVSPGDPATFAAVVLLLGAVSLVACYIPAYRAATIDPNVALRRE